MRMLLLSHDYPPYGGADGAMTEALARALASRGVTVDVVTAADRSECRTELLWDGDASEEGLLNLYRLRCRRVQVSRTGVLDVVSYVMAAHSAVRRLLRAQEYDAIHVFFSPSTAALIPWLKLGRVPVIVSLQGSDTSGDESRRRSLRRARALLRPLSLDYTAIPNGVDLVRFHPPASRRSRRSGPVRCIAVSRVLEGRGLADVIRATAQLERGAYELDIVGTGRDEHALRELAAGLRLEGIVKFSGSLDSASIARRYREADLFTLASGEEESGDVLAEVLASGLPIVGSSVAAGDDLIRHERNGLLVPPGDPAALAAAIRHLGESPMLRAEIGRRNRGQAEAMLSWDRIVTRYISLYKGARRQNPVRSRLADMPSSSW